MVRRLRPAAAILAVALTSALVLSCGGGGGAPSTPSNPTPTAQPTATPPPTGGGGVGSSSCSIGSGSTYAECAKGGSARLLDAVYVAQDVLVQQQPQVFDKKDEAGDATGQYRVLDRDAYLNGVVSNLRAAGHCAQRDPDDYTYERIQVKNENAFSESYDILSATGYMRRNGIYVETCTPSSFPVDRGDLPPAGSGCGKPYPPPISRFNAKVHVPGQPALLDSTPLVADLAYCNLIGYTDRAFCPVRMEGSPERVACEAWAVGNARDTGRAGPTWTRMPEGTPCTGPASGCSNHEWGLRRGRRRVLSEGATRGSLDPRRAARYSSLPGFGRLTQR